MELEWTGTQAIPDKVGLVVGETFIDFAGVPAVSTVDEVAIYMTHSYMGDVHITLIAPDGSTTVLYNREDGSGDNMGGPSQDTRFRDDAFLFIYANSPNYLSFPTYKPRAPLSALNGKAAGTWRVRFQDHEAGDTGAVRHVKLIVTEVMQQAKIGKATAPMTARGLHLDQGRALSIGKALAPMTARSMEVTQEAPPLDYDRDDTGFDDSHPDFEQAWSEGNMIGPMAPHKVVEVREGRFNRGYVHVEGDNIVDADIPGESGTAPWMAWWTPQTDWMELDGVANVRLQQSFDQNGMMTGTVAVENTRLLQRTGVGALDYHVVERGYLSPTRGYDPPHRSPADVDPNEWSGVLRRAVQVRIWMGYGPPQRDGGGNMPVDGGTNGSWVFVGMSDDLDLDSLPDHATISVREGQTLTDQRVFGWAKSKQLKDPVVFSDRLEADNIIVTWGDASASSERAGSPAENATDNSVQTAWRSDDHTTPGNTEWVQILLPPGRYTDFVLHPAYEGMDLYIGFYAAERDGEDPKVNGEEVSPGWVDIEGGGTVPGGHGGWQYTRLVPGISGAQRVRKIGAEIVCGAESILRVGFRNLKRIDDDTYRAGVIKLRGRQRKLSQDAKDGKWILVDDVSDAVKIVLRWAGFPDWDVESTGVRLKGKTAFNRANFLFDVIKAAQAQTGYVFFIASPKDGESYGIPVFRQNRARYVLDTVREIKDDDLLTNISFKEALESLAYTIRVRGKKADSTAGGTQLGGDLTERVMAVYRPPWGYRLDTTSSDRLAGILKPVTHTMPELRDVDECMEAARLIALEQALASSQAVAEIPGHPGAQLDQQIGVEDHSTAVNSRLWVAERVIEFVTGRTTSWKGTLQGPLLDTPELAALIAELEGTTLPGASGTVVAADYMGVKPIPDEGTADIPLHVIYDGEVANVKVSLKILDHTYPQDLVLSLLHPDGTEVRLVEHGGTGDDGETFGSKTQALTFTDGATRNLYTDTKLNHVGNFIPDEPLSAFDGMPSGGTWILRCFDEWGGDVGNLSYAAIEVTLA